MSEEGYRPDPAVPPMAPPVGQVPPPPPPPPAPAGVVAVGKERSPWAVAGLSIITFGLYLIFWWYFVNTEMKEFARARQVTHPLATSSPGSSTVAVSVGALVLVPVFITSHTTTRRVCQTLDLAGDRGDRPSPALYMLMFTLGGLLVIPPFFYAPLLQSRLNRVWSAHRPAGQRNY